MKIFSRTPAPQPQLNHDATMAEMLKSIKTENLLAGLTAELQAWTTEVFDNDRVQEVDAGVDELARRMEMHPSSARAFLANHAESCGVFI